MHNVKRRNSNDHSRMRMEQRVYDLLAWIMRFFCVQCTRCTMPIIHAYTHAAHRHRIAAAAEKKKNIRSRAESEK